MKNIVYVKKVDNENDILKKEYQNKPKFFTKKIYYKISYVIKKIIFFYKNIFNIITRKKIDEYEVWVLPIQANYSSFRKIKVLLKKLANNHDNIYLLPESMYEPQNLKIINEIERKIGPFNYLTGEKLKKILAIKAIEYIADIQKIDISSIELTILVNNTSELNIYLIKELAKTVKNIKIVSSNLYKFKKLEETLYEDFGIAIQFSNSYKKSLAKSQMIINLDFNEMDINEYTLFEKGIIINCTENKLKIKSMLFNGVIVNSYQIEWKKELQDKFKTIGLYNQYNSFLLYESIINTNYKISQLFDKIEEDKIKIIGLIGNKNIRK